MATFTGADKAIGFLFDMVANMAEDYDATSTYAVNDYSVYNGVLYKCTSAISVAEDFTPAHWTAVLIMDEIGAGGGGGGSTTLAGLNDVALSSVADGDVLIYDSSLNKWKNGSSSGSGHTYSTTEKNVGIWVDGNTLYEKTYVFTIANLNDGLVDSSVIRGNFYLDIANVSSIWIDYGASFLKNTYSGLNPKSLSLNYAAGGSNYTRTNIQQSAVNSGLPFIYFENTWAASVFYDARSYLTWYITVKYTKTS